MKRKKFCQKGFTLIEICLAGVIILVLFSIAWPILSRYAKEAHINETCKIIASTMVYARDSALVEGKRFSIEFDKYNRTFYLSIEEDPVSKPGEFVKIEDSLQRKRIWTKAVEVKKISSEKLVFNPDGISENFFISLCGKNDNTVSLFFDGLNGKCNFKKGNISE